LSRPDIMQLDGEPFQAPPRCYQLTHAGEVAVLKPAVSPTGSTPSRARVRWW
jgi:hypothetical protein